MEFKNVVVIYFGDDWHVTTPFTSDLTRKSFEDWNDRGQEIEVNFFRASIDWYDIEKGVFLKSWSYRNGSWQKSTEPIKPDLIFDKVVGARDYSLFETKKEMSKKVPFFNNALFRVMLNSKLSQALLFKEHMALTKLILNESGYQEALVEMPGDKIVIKPIYGSGGDGILIDQKDKIKTELIEYPSVAQEFIESTKGIPGFSKKDEIADLRIVYLDHKFIYALSRIAKEGSYFTNLHQGAEAIIVPEKSIPESVNELAGKIIDKLSIFPYAHYSLDFIFKDDGEPVLIEMNTTPGFDLLYVLGDEKIKEDNFNKFIQSARKIMK